MKVKKIILRDEVDTQFDDLITYEEEVDLGNIIELVKYVKNNVEDYTNEDIYDALETLGKYELEYIGQYPIVEY